MRNLIFALSAIVLISACVAQTNSETTTTSGGRSAATTAPAATSASSAADLVIEDLRIIKSSNAALGPMLTVNAKIRNAGGVKSNANRMHFQVDDVATGKFVYSEDLDVGDLDAGFSQEILKTNYMPKDGSYKVVLRADKNNEVPESNENNNEASLDFQVPLS